MLFRSRTALIYGIDGGDYIIVASKGGHPSHPLWYENLLIEPKVEIQVGAHVLKARAITIEDDLRYVRVWNQMAAIWPGFNEYREKTTRRIPLIALTQL